MADDHRLMTYAEAAKLLGIKPDSVKRRARNRKWHRQKNNEGLTLVGIPLSIIPEEAPEDVLGDIQPDIPADNPDTALLVKNAELKTENNMLRDAMDDLRSDRDAWRDMAQKRRSWWPFNR